MVLEKIKSTAYWRVNLRPQRFRERLLSLSECLRLVEASHVRLRGWDYPHFREQDIKSGDDWIESTVDWGDHIEYWRFFQSGQFIHYFAAWEDYREVPWVSSEYPSGKPDRYLEPVGVVYQVTEIFEFAARLVQRGVFDSGAVISISIHGTKDRQLAYWRGLERLLSRRYVCELDAVAVDREPTLAELTSGSSQLALQVAVDIFERFNWFAVPTDLFAEDQRRLLERNL